MSTSTRWLVLVERGLRMSDVRRVLDARGIAQARVVSEDRLPAEPDDGKCFECSSFSDAVMVHGTLDCELLVAAQRIVQRLGQRARSASPGAFAYLGVDLLTLAETSLRAGHFHTALVNEHVLAALLAQESFRGVIVLGGRGHLERGVRRLAPRALPVAVESPDTHAPARVLRDAYARVARGWSDQLILDARYRVRAGRPRVADGARETYVVVTSDIQVACWAVVEPVMRELAVDSRVVAVTNGAFAHASAAIPGVEYRTFADLLAPAQWAGVVLQARRVRRAWMDVLDPLAADVPAGYSPAWYRDTILTAGSIARLLERAILWLAALDRCFRVHTPRALCVVPDFAPVTQAAVELARRWGVPSVTIQNGLRLDNPRTPPVLADIAAVHDEWTKHVFVARSAIEPDRVVVTGHPRWDGAFAKPADDSARARAVMRTLDVGDDERIVVYLTQPLSMQVQRMVLAAIAKASSGLGGARLVIKTHPREDSRIYQALVAQLEWAAAAPIVIGQVPLHDLLRRSELVISCFSTGAMEAALLDRPVLLVNLTGDPIRTVITDAGLALQANDEASVAEHIRELMTDSDTRRGLARSRRAFMRENDALLDGGSARRVAELLRERRA